ncbi:hypothetical protein KAI04_04070 [Candidatus Pacearchaeota archaeon]|nr:hypothetical protein [Candidatus Pacearchaeota archaeon]
MTAKKVINLEELTVKDIIETFVTYDLEHCKFPHNYFIEVMSRIPRIEGVTLDDQKLILINNENGLEKTRQVIIHELLHTKHYRQGNLELKRIEKQVVAETKFNYMKIYGVNPF